MSIISLCHKSIGGILTWNNTEIPYLIINFYFFHRLLSLYILAFETSCDDTSVAVMRDDECIALSTRTQLEHDITGGVVPEVAARSHANAIFPCIDEALSEAGMSLNQIDVIACTEKPGLLPSLLTGMTVAKTLSLTLEKPLLWINHIEWHIFANYLGRTESDIMFPAVVLTVSGGHTEIYLWKSMFELEMIGQSRDDAAGESFDKVAKMMGLGFPGGAKIARLAEKYRRDSLDSRKSWPSLFPEVMLESDSLDFSFSWIKTAVKREIDRELLAEWKLSDTFMRYIAYEFEETVTNILSKKLQRAQQHTSAQLMLLAGWVSANSTLRTKLEMSAKYSWVWFLAPTKILYSMDNAAMIGIRAYYEHQRTI